MHELAAKDACFADFKFSCYAVGVSLQEKSRPTGTHDVVKPWFSGKHVVYGYKSKFSVILTGICIGRT